MIEQNNVDAQFDEKDIEQIFGGASVKNNLGISQEDGRFVYRKSSEPTSIT